MSNENKIGETSREMNPGVLASQIELMTLLESQVLEVFSNVEIENNFVINYVGRRFRIEKSSVVFIVSCAQSKIGYPETYYVISSGSHGCAGGWI